MIPAKIVPIQKVHLQPMLSAQKPDMMGAMSGPSTVATMKNAIDLPLDLGSPNMSANMPAEMTIGPEADIPERSRKIKNEGKFRARAQAIVKIVKKKKATRVMRRRPYCSDAGAKNIGPCPAVSLR